MLTYQLLHPEILAAFRYAGDQLAVLDFLREENARHRAVRPLDRELDARIKATGHENMMFPLLM